MYVVDAESEGQIGFLVAQELAKTHHPRAVLPIISRTEVSRRDPAFRNPTKPVGSYYTANEAKRLRAQNGWTMREDRRRGGWRRVVPSPRPLKWLEGNAVRAAMDAGLGSRCVFVVTGGGGIPVVRSRGGRWQGVDAVIDKDRSAALVALQLGASTLAIVTDVPGAAVGFGTSRQRWLGRTTTKELESCLKAGEFGVGSMRPKVSAVLEFLKGGGRRAVITDIPSLRAALAGRAGTRVAR
jgi:carbamate kinase